MREYTTKRKLAHKVQDINAFVRGISFKKSGKRNGKKKKKKNGKSGRRGSGGLGTSGGSGAIASSSVA